MQSIRRRGVLVGGVVAVALWLPAGALAAEKPTVTTGGVALVTPTSAQLKGKVDPNGAATTVLFQYGTSRLYESRTVEVGIGGGTKVKPVAMSVANLTPNTRYHYRLVARNRRGLTFGRDRTFRTDRQPLALSLAGTPNPVRTGRSTVLSGVLTGTGNANRQVQLQANPWPYTGGFQPIGNNLVTTATGAFSLPILSVGVNTQYRAVLVPRPEVASPVLVLGTTVKVTRHVRVRRGERRGRIRFFGRITPPENLAQVLIQKLRRGNWVTITNAFVRTGSKSTRYSRRIRQRRGGRYRVVAVDVSGAHSISVSKSIRVRRVRRS